MEQSFNYMPRVQTIPGEYLVRIIERRTGELLLSCVFQDLNKALKSLRNFTLQSPLTKRWFIASITDVLHARDLDADKLIQGMVASGEYHDAEITHDVDEPQSE